MKHTDMLRIKNYMELCVDDLRRVLLEAPSLNRLVINQATEYTARRIDEFLLKHFPDCYLYHWKCTIVAVPESDNVIIDVDIRVALIAQIDGNVVYLGKSITGV